MNKNEEKLEESKNPEETLDNVENITKPDTSGFFTLTYKNGDKFSGTLLKG